MTRTAVLYDYLQVNGGAERVTLELARRLENTDAWVGRAGTQLRALSNSDEAQVLANGALSRHSVIRALDAIRLFRKGHRSFSNYDFAIFSGHFAPLAHHHFRNARKMMYCHSPPLPFITDPYDEALGWLPDFVRPGANFLLAPLSGAFKTAVRSMDCVIANSDFVARQYQIAYGIEAITIHPPCQLEAFSWAPDDGFYMSFARHEKMKRVARVVEAFKTMRNHRLVVASSGSQTGKLKILAGKAANIRFIGDLNRQELAKILATAIATIYIPRDEPFGLSAVESLASGKPVIASNSGGLPEIVSHRKSGFLVSSAPNVAEIQDAIRFVSRTRSIAMRGDCESAAKPFGQELFFSKMREAIYT